MREYETVTGSYKWKILQLEAWVRAQRIAEGKDVETENRAGEPSSSRRAAGNYLEASNLLTFAQMARSMVIVALLLPIHLRESGTEGLCEVSVLFGRVGSIRQVLPLLRHAG